MKNRAIMIDTNAISRLMLGDERFVSIVNLNHFDYTEWRRDHLFVGETVDTLVDKIRAFEREHPELAEMKVSHA